jgi:hypothetical protein
MKHYFSCALAKKLCGKAHGSGLNTEPVISDMPDGRRVQIAWDYHLMDEDGYYCGYWRFIVKIPMDRPMEFTLNGRAGNPQGKSAYGIKAFLGAMFNGLLAEVLQEAGISWELVNDKIYPEDPDYNPSLPWAQEHGYHYGRAHYEYSGELAEG